MLYRLCMGWEPNLKGKRVNTTFQRTECLKPWDDRGNIDLIKLD